MTVNVHVSDLFFNYDLCAAEVWDAGDFMGWDEQGLNGLADEFLSSLGALTSEVPSVEELVSDFLNRV